jgi:aspartyl protease family protein
VSDPDRALNLVYLVGVLVLVASGLAARRLPLGRTLNMALAWLLIFAAGFLVLAAKDDLGDRVQRLWRQDAAEEAKNDAAARSIRIRKSPDGHFWVDGRVNGRKIRFLIDSGATVTSLSVASAERAGVDYHGDFPTLVDTANGVIPVQRGRAQTLAVGAIVRHDMAVQVAEAFGDTNVLGMNFLSSLSGWGVEGPWLVMKA